MAKAQTAKDVKTPFGSFGQPAHALKVRGYRRETRKDG